MTKLVIAVDPGLKTGYAVFQFEDDASEPTLLYDAELDQKAYYERIADDISGGVEAGSEVHVVCEDFKITAQTGKLGESRWSLKLIGMTEYLCYMSDVPFTLQTPADAKNFVDNDRLRALGFWHVGEGGHANDALRHGILYMVRTFKWMTQKFLD